MTTAVRTSAGKIQLPGDPDPATLLALHADHTEIESKALPTDLTTFDILAHVDVSLETDAMKNNKHIANKAKDLQSLLQTKLQNRYTCTDAKEARFVLKVYITQVQWRRLTGQHLVGVEWFLMSTPSDNSPTEIYRAGRASPGPWSRQDAALVSSVSDSIVKAVQVRRRQSVDFTTLDEKQRKKVRESESYDYAEHIYEDH